MLSFSSIPTVINNFISYLPYKWVPSTEITGRQVRNPSMHGLKAQNTN